MKTKLILLFLISTICGYSQTEISTWTMNAGQYASYWENTNGNPTNPSFVFNTTTILADVTQVCYNSSMVFVQSKGMTTNMGQYLNPGIPLEQSYTFGFPRTQTVPTTKTISPKEGTIGLLKNGIPINGLGNAKYYNGTGNNGNGTGTWNVEVFYAEGFVLDATLGAHPQQQGKYHSHAKPYSLYSASGTTNHSPIVGYAFDGYPIYGPYGYNSPLDNTSAITRMKSGYSLRNITTRTTLPYGVALSVANYGPAVNTTYPIGTYCEDYEWLATNAGHLDKYNGRFCKTPEYPSGTYAYFTTITSAGVAQFPYYIGIEYYGAPNTANIGMTPTVTIPSTGVTCFTTALATNEYQTSAKITAFPNPSNGNFNIVLPDLSGESLVEIFTIDGRLIFSKTANDNTINANIDNTSEALLILKVTNNGQQFVTKMMMR